MTLQIPPLYHWWRSVPSPQWSPIECRARIRKRGLKPSTPTAVWMRPLPPGFMGHTHVDRPLDALAAVCLGTSPSTAWALSGGIHAEKGSRWDLWEVELDHTDEVHYRAEYGDRLDEVRVIGWIPTSRVWHVGARTVGNGSRWYHAP